MKSNLAINGLIVPVFTPLNDDKKRSVNLGMIDVYCSQLKSMGVQGVIVNALTGEGMALTLQERMQVAERWCKVARQNGLLILLNICGMDLPDCCALAEQAEQLKVDAVLVLPDLCYRPIVEQDLVLYIKNIVALCPSIPVVYYHIPMMTRVRLNMLVLMQLLEKEVNLAGILWACQMDNACMLRCQMPNLNIIMGCGVSVMACLAQGFRAISLTACNLYPELVRQICDLMASCKVKDALVIQEQLVQRVCDLLRSSNNIDWVAVMKLEMSKLHPAMQMGPVRKPVCSAPDMMSVWSGRM